MTRPEDPGQYDILWANAQRLWWQQPRKRAMLLTLLFALVVIPLVYSQSGTTVEDAVSRQGNINTYLLSGITIMMGIIGFFLKSLVTDIRSVKDEYIRMNEVQRHQAEDIRDLEKSKPHSP